MYIFIVQCNAHDFYNKQSSDESELSVAVAYVWFVHKVAGRVPPDCLRMFSTFRHSTTSIQPWRRNEPFCNQTVSTHDKTAMPLHSRHICISTKVD